MEPLVLVFSSISNLEILSNIRPTQNIGSSHSYKLTFNLCYHPILYDSNSSMFETYFWNESQTNHILTLESQAVGETNNVTHVLFCFFLLFQSKHNRQSQRIKKKNMSNVWMWWIWLWNETLLEKTTTQNCPLWKTQNNLFQSQIFCFEVTKTI